MRCFIAAPVQGPALVQVQLLVDELRVTVPGVRWTAATPHVTLHFFGSVDDDMADAVMRDLRLPLRGFRAFSVSLDRLGAFPDRGTPRVLWLGSSQESAELQALARVTREVVAAHASPVEDRAFRPHCTLGRPREPWPAAARDAWRARVARGVGEHPVRVDRIVLFESRTGAGGAVHTPRITLPLADMRSGAHDTLRA